MGGQYYKSTTEVTALSLVALQPFNVLEFISFAEFDLQQNKTYLTYHILICNKIRPISHPTPRIALFVRSSVTKKDRITDACTIHTCMLQNQGPGS